MHSKRSPDSEILVLPLRDIVVYPNMIIPLFIGRKKSIICLEKAIKENKKIMLVTQKKSSKDDPNTKDFFSVGTVSSVLQILKLPDGTFKILVEGLYRAKIINLKNKGKIFIASIKIFNCLKIKEKKQKILKRIILNQFENYLKLNKKIPSEIFLSLNNINNIEKLTDTIASHIPLKLSKKQDILEIEDINERLEYLITTLETEINILEIEKKIRDRVKKQISKTQKEYYLNEQIKAIQKELNQKKDINFEYHIFKRKIKKITLPKEAKKKIKLELKKLQLMPSMSSEAAVIKNYLDWIIQIPWNKTTKIKKNLEKAKDILNKDHFGLEHVKERILEYLAVQNRSSTQNKSPILCFIGPPGVGKTSLGKSIAKATGRKYMKISLGGIKDEAEIRGHRKTYIGSMPGNIIQKIIKSKVNNPLLLLDEIDKISSDYSRGDPISALLEVLDPEQNSAFNDHYIEIDFDLSNVMFISTANSPNIPIPLLDRMEIIKLSGYSEEEKVNIAKKYLIPKQIKNNYLNKEEILINHNVIQHIIRYYTREAGVRNLEREIAKICRKVVKKIYTNPKIKSININRKNLKKYLGIKKISLNIAKKKNLIGQVTGLAWTEAGGDLLIIESQYIPGKGKLIYTGSLGKVMKESIKTSLTVTRSLSNQLKIKKDFYFHHDIHIHVPEGAIPKDGPSAGIAICTSLISALTQNPIKSYIAMTGEITLYGNILPIGGLKEKLLAALRAGIKHVIIPKGNKKDLKEIPGNIKKHIKIYTVKNITEVLIITLKNYPFN